MFFLLNSITNTEIIKLDNTMSVLCTYTNSQIDVKRVDLANVYKPGKVYKFNAFLGKSLKSGSWNPKYLYLLEHKKNLKDPSPNTYFLRWVYVIIANNWHFKLQNVQYSWSIITLQGITTTESIFQYFLLGILNLIYTIKLSSISNY